MHRSGVALSKHSLTRKYSFRDIVLRPYHLDDAEARWQASEVSPPMLLSSCTPSVLRYCVKRVMSEVLLSRSISPFPAAGG